MTLSIERVEARTLGALIALFERAVGFYASLIGVNAYHQPGVEAGKRAAAGILKLQAGVLAHLDDEPKTALEIAGEICGSEAFSVQGEKPAPGALAEDVHLLLEHLEANGRAEAVSPGLPAQATFRARKSG